MDEIRPLIHSAFSEGSSASSSRIQPATSHLLLPLSIAQEWWWRVDGAEPSTQHRSTTRVVLRGKLNRRALLTALDRIVARHQVLRTTFHDAEGRPIQVAEPPTTCFALIEQQVEGESALEQITRQEVARPFDLSRGPLIRGRLLKLSHHEHALLISHHWIVADRSSIGMFIRELATLYSAFVLGRGDPLPPLELQYADYASWQHRCVTEAELNKQLAFWKRCLDGAPEGVRLPANQARGALRTHSRDRVALEIPAQLARQLQELSQREGTTVFVTLLTSWAVLLGRWSGQEDIVIGARVANRWRRETEALIGPFDNIAALRIQWQDDPTTRDLLRRVMTTFVEAGTNDEVPFEQAVAGEERALPIVVEWNDASAAVIESGGLQLPDLHLGDLHIEESGPHTQLRLSLHEGQGALAGTLEFAGDLFERELVDRLIASWHTLLGSLVADPESPISKLTILTAAERGEVLYRFNESPAGHSPDKLIHELFEAQVRRTPEAKAISFKSEQLTFAALNGKANQLARYLRDRGVGPDERVALCVERGLEMVVAMLGVLKAGGAYVPLDPGYPAERLTYMLEDAAPRVLITQQHLRALLPDIAKGIVLVDGDWKAIEENSPADLPSDASSVSPRNLAYIIYTSGSTGQPKGAMNEHRGMANRILSQRYIEAFSVDDICCQKTSISFVDAVFEIFGALCNGRPLVIVPAEDVSDMRRMASLIESERVTRLITVPSMAWSMLESEEVMRALSGLRSWTLSGEEVRPELLMRLQQKLPGCDFIDQYGCSEVSSDASCFRTRAFTGERVPIGRPVPNVRIYVLDPHGQPVPAGVTGEIHVAGVGVGRGYFNRPELTETRFLRDSFGSGQDLMYRSGDLGRWRKDGLLEYLGRRDHQVKIRGFRIEPGEIESQLLCHPVVSEAVVFARQDVEADTRLVAYVTLKDASASASRTAERLRSHLRARLPEFMVPAAVVVLEELPRTPNGKIDRRALPAPGREAYETQPYTPPAGPTESVVAAIWKDLLRVERVGRHDNFFALGGHSLRLVQMLESLRHRGLTTEVRNIYASPTLAEFASTLTEARAQEIQIPPNLIPPDCDAITAPMLPLVQLSAEEIGHIVRTVPGGAANVQDIYPLTPLQEGMLFHHLLDEERASGDAYVETTLLSVASRERLEELIAALQAVIDRHDILRTAVLWEGLPRPVQVVYREALLPVEDVHLNRSSSPDEQLRQLMRAQLQRLDLTRAPLMRLEIAQEPQGDRWYALLQLHHMIDDDTSLKILISEVVAHLQQRSHVLPEPVPYRTHVAEALSRTQVRDASAFFRRKLGDITEPTAPFGLLDVRGEGSQVDESPRALDRDLVDRLREQARHMGVSVATLFHAAWALVVAHTSARDDVVFGTVLLGRLQGSAGARQTIGMFINTLPLRLPLHGITASELIERTRAELVELLGYEQSSLAVAQRCSGVEGGAPLFSSVINFRHGATQPEAEWTSAPGIRVLSAQYRTNYPVSLAVDDSGDGITLTAHTDRRIPPERVVGYVRTALESLLDALENAPTEPALALRILPERERRQVIDTFNGTEVAFPQDKLLGELFEEQVKRTPDAIAVVYEDQSLSYAELNRRANQLARHLVARGVGPDQPVGLCMERSVEMVVGVLGILKAGGAYVPLDPIYPRERLAGMLKDAAPTLLLTEASLKKQFQDGGCELVALDADWPDVAAGETHDFDARARGLSSDNLAYIIYTSGSTGRPKGVMVRHRNVTSLWQGLGDIYRQTPGCEHIAVNAPFNFDASVKQLVQLLSGRTLFIVPQECRFDATLLIRYLQDHAIHGIDCTPSQLKTWIDEGLLDPQKCAVRMVLVGGEAIDAELWSSLAVCEHIDFYNVYGPTECTVDATFARLRGDTSQPHIGPPMQNRRVYILGHCGQPAPLGVPGEMYLGGAGVARGYLNRPELTAERFLPNPFDTDSGARMYRSGDLARWRPDGTVEYLGRNDNQVKIRGFRIELGEIEAQLLQHPDVRQAVVLARDDERGEKRLVAYVAAEMKQQESSGTEEATADMVAQWNKVHDETYSAGSTGPSFIGWNSSYTGQPIPAAEMEEWLARTIERIRALKPRRVLEIGCGVGLVMQHLAPECEIYVGADFAASALSRLQHWLNEREDLKHVQLLHRGATELQDLQSGSFDTVVLNSVVQYFPDIDYLLAVLRDAVRLLAPGGKIFVGDVRHLGLLQTFHSAVQLGKSGATISMGQLRSRIARAIAQEKELVIDPQFFQLVGAELPGIASADVQMKRGRAHNELTRYRYDVILHTCAQDSIPASPEQIAWTASSGADLQRALSEHRWLAARVHSMPNLRVVREVAARRLIETSDDGLETGALRRQLAEMESAVVDPEAVCEQAEARGYDVCLRWDRNEPECFEMHLLDRAGAADLAVARVARAAEVPRAWREYANNPLENSLRQQLIPQLKEHLKGRLPEYMVPVAWMVMKQLPLTPNGKVDRRALPNSMLRPEELGEYVPPQTEAERRIATIWEQVLQVDQVGVQDNFFEIGGHSLLAMQVIVRIRSSLSIDVPMRLLFDFPTVKRLAAEVEALRQTRLLHEIEAGDLQVQELLEKVADMPESRVQEMLRELRTRVQP